MKERVFVDTSAWYAFVNRADPDHETVRELLEATAGNLVTSNFVFDETVTLCLYRIGHQAASRVGEALLDPAVVDVIRATAEDEAEAWRMFLDRPDKNYSFTDCVSFVMMIRLRLKKVAALDRDFEREGFERLPVAGNT